MFPLQLWVIWKENKRVGRFNNPVSSNIGGIKGLLQEESRIERKPLHILFPLLECDIFISPNATEYSHCKIYHNNPTWAIAQLGAFLMVN